jgi:hypothetical protein
VNGHRLLALAIAAVMGAAVWTAAGAGAASSKPACSAAGLSPKLPKQQLPARVASMRDRIAAAAVRCDYAALARLARENGRTFVFSYGSGRDPAAYWRRLETQHLDRPLARLVGILRLPYTRNEIRSFAWPSAYTEKPTAMDWNLLVQAKLYTRAQIAGWKRYGSYLGYRTAISPKGDWLFFVAGD